MSDADLRQVAEIRHAAAQQGDAIRVVLCDRVAERFDREMRRALAQALRQDLAGAIHAFGLTSEQAWQSIGQASPPAS